MFAKLSAEKGSLEYCHTIEKSEEPENRRNETCLIFITSKSTCLNSSNAKFILLKTAGYFMVRAFCKGKQGKETHYEKKRKQIAVKQSSIGESKGSTRRS